jgi:hypothetical protein
LACGDDDDVIAIVEDKLEWDLTLVVDDILFAAENHLALVGGSTLDAIGAVVLGRSIDDVSAPALTDIPLPWIKDLTISELLRLRERADHSLPKLRSLLADLYAAGRKAPSIINEILAQVADVEAELAARHTGDAAYHVAVEALAASLIVFGVSTGNAPLIGSSIAAFLASLVHLQNLSRERAKQVATTSTRPAFALVEAKRLIAQRTA